MKTWKADSGIRPRGSFVRLLVLSAGGTCTVPLAPGDIDCQISQLSCGASGASAPVYTYTYSLSGFDFQLTGTAFKEVDIKFNPNVYGVLSHGLQPNNARCATDACSAAGTADHPSLAGTFYLDSAWIGPRSPLDTGIALGQRFHINTSGNNPGDASVGNLISSTSGTTTIFATSAVPEPSTVFLTVEGTIVFGADVAVTTRRSETAC